MPSVGFVAIGALAAIGIWGGHAVGHALKTGWAQFGCLVTTARHCPPSKLPADKLAFALTIRHIPPESTPGAIDARVVVVDLQKTICASGYTKTVRPTEAYTNTLKARQMKERHLVGKPDLYEEDHRVPLELGGSPISPDNLWPEPWPEAREKDRLENAIKKDVCKGVLTLEAGQAIFLSDFWAEYDRRYGKAK